MSSVREVKYIGQMHQFLGNFFITVVGLHACAALIHHFIFKDNVLKSMLFKKMKWFRSITIENRHIVHLEQHALLI